MITLHSRHFISLLALFFVLIGIAVVQAWTGPTQAPPSGNVAAPINVGTTDQVKDAGLGLNSLAVFGNAILSGVNRYLNFGTIAGESGYGIRDNVGVLEFKNNGGSWESLPTIIQNFFSASSENTISEIKFADGTTQTTAASSTQQTIASCAIPGGVWAMKVCTATCPSGYVRSGCTHSRGGEAAPVGSNACECKEVGGTCYAFCIK